jgi:hypothetical protein
MKPGEVPEKSPPECSLRPILNFNVNDKESWVPLKPDVSNKVGFKPFAGGYVNEDFLVPGNLLSLPQRRHELRAGTSQGIPKRGC